MKRTSVDEKILPQTQTPDLRRPNEQHLHNLQFLRINSLGVNSRSMNHISQKLRVLEWPMFGMKCFPSSFNPKFLVKLEMPYSKLEKLWEETKLLSNLKWMDLNHSIFLEELPDLSTATNLCDLNLSYCPSLVKLPSSIGNAVNMETFSLSKCSNLVEIPSSITTIASLKSLKLNGCSGLVELPLNIETVIDPIDIDLSRCSSLVKLPFSIGNAINLQKLNLSYCSSLVELPSSIGNATNLQKLDLIYCSSLVELPSSIGSATNLQKLDLSYCSSLVELPSSIGNATNLQKLNLSYCLSLVKLPSSIGNATSLQELNLSHCSSLVKLPSSIGNVVNLRRLNLSDCSSLMELPSSIWTAVNLNTLDLSDCSSMVELPSFTRNLKCSKLETNMVNINFESVGELNLSDCSLLKSYHESSTNIKELDPWFGRESRLLILVLNGMKKLVSLPQLPDWLWCLDAEDCESLERLDYSFYDSDIRLNFTNCFKLNQEARDLICRRSASGHTVFPATELPMCFTYRSYGNSVTVKLNQMPLGIITEFNACILCAHVDGNNSQLWEIAYVCCRITSGGNSLTACYRRLEQYFPGHLFTFKVMVDTDEITSTDLVFEFEIHFGDSLLDETCEIKECGILQLLEVPFLSFRDGDEPSDKESGGTRDEDYETSDNESLGDSYEYHETSDKESFGDSDEDHGPSDREI